MKEISCCHSTCLSPLEDKGSYFYTCHSCGEEIYNSHEPICKICGSPMLLNDNVAICSNPYCPAYSFQLCSHCSPFHGQENSGSRFTHGRPINFPESYRGVGCLQIKAVYNKRTLICLDLTKADFSGVSKSFIHSLHKQWIKEMLHQDTQNK